MGKTKNKKENKTKLSKPPENSENKEIQQINKYLKMLWWPIIVTIIFEITALFTKNKDTLIMVANMCLIFYVIFKTQLKDHKTAAWLGGSIMFFLALIVSLAKFIINFKFYYLFTVITEPIVYGISGAIFSSATVLIINKLKQ